jgi:hypothetical protein
MNPFEECFVSSLCTERKKYILRSILQSLLLFSRALPAYCIQMFNSSIYNKSIPEYESVYDSLIELQLNTRESFLCFQLTPVNCEWSWTVHSESYEKNIWAQLTKNWLRSTCPLMARCDLSQVAFNGQLAQARCDLSQVGYDFPRIWTLYPTWSGWTIFLPILT